MLSSGKYPPSTEKKTYLNQAFLGALVALAVDEVVAGV
jgi:hypothetical protein